MDGEEESTLSQQVNFNLICEFKISFKLKEKRDLNLILTEKLKILSAAKLRRKIPLLRKVDVERRGPLFSWTLKETDLRGTLCLFAI